MATKNSAGQLGIALVLVAAAACGKNANQSPPQLDPEQVLVQEIDYMVSTFPVLVWVEDESFDALEQRTACTPVAAHEKAQLEFRYISPGLTWGVENETVFASRIPDRPLASRSLNGLAPYFGAGVSCDASEDLVPPAPADFVVESGAQASAFVRLTGGLGIEFLDQAGVSVDEFFTMVDEAVAQTDRPVFGVDDTKLLRE